MRFGRIFNISWAQLEAAISNVPRELSRIFYVIVAQGRLLSLRYVAFPRMEDLQGRTGDGGEAPVGGGAIDGSYRFFGGPPTAYYIHRESRGWQVATAA